MQRSIVTTRDGSHTISIPAMQVTYHSIHGAIQESEHVFIHAGLEHVSFSTDKPLRIFEMGFGTGLNALLTLAWAIDHKKNIDYTAIEPFPLENEETRTLNYAGQLDNVTLQTDFEKIHAAGWDELVLINDHFSLRKIKDSLEAVRFDSSFDLIYYDAFAPTAQPELWTEEIFSKLFKATNEGGVLVTYCSKSVVQRAMRAAGWQVEKIPGPHGKREMVRATRVQ